MTVIQSKKRLSVEPYKGVRDFYPEDAFIQTYLFDTMRSVAESYGFQNYNASILEDTDLYKSKSSTEIVADQTYTFVDRGGREVTLRPEMTPTVARMIARKRKELAFPLRWYSIANMFRYERPQRGRLRGHWQLNVELFGVGSIDAEMEIVMMAHDILIAFGAEAKDFVIRLNHRALLDTFFTEQLNMEARQYGQLSKLLDRRPKITEEEFVGQLKGIVSDEGRQQKIHDLLAAKSIKDLDDGLAHLKEINDLQTMIDALKDQNIESVEFDPSLVRGFDYYTGIVFEVFDRNPRCPNGFPTHRQDV